VTAGRDLRRAPRWLRVGAAVSQQLGTDRSYKGQAQCEGRAEIADCELVRYRFAARAEYSDFAPGKREPPMTSERLSFDLLDFGPSPLGFARRFLVVFARWRQRARQRAALAQLPAYMLRDIGLTEADVWRETRLPPWRQF
jgi:uncharacterized protein YjiS (DUF1127 family)